MLRAFLLKMLMSHPKLTYNLRRTFSYLLYLALKSFTVAKAVGSVYISYINASYPGTNSGTKRLLTVETVNNALGSLLAKKERRFVVCFCRVKCRSVVSDNYVSVILFFRIQYLINKYQISIFESILNSQ